MNDDTTPAPGDLTPPWAADLRSLLTDIRDRLDHAAAELIGVAEAARLVGMGERWIWKAAAQGTFPRPVKQGGRTLWRRRDVLRYLDRLS